jgi:hypothetical protein
MKINEVVITEGVWDKLKAVGAGAKGAWDGLGSNMIQGAKAGAAASTAKSQQQDLINRVAQKAIAGWSTQSQNIKTSTGKAPTPEQLADWWKRYTKGQDTTGTDNPLPTNLNNNAAVVAWLNKEVAGYMAKKSMPADTAPAGLDTKSAAAGAEVDTPAQGKVTKREDGKWYNEQGQQIVNPKDVAELEKRAKLKTTGGQDQTQAQTQTKIFSDPAAFKTEWDKYVASKGGEKYQLIADPEMLDVLKNIWMRTGGTKLAEGRRSKKERV